MVDVDVVDVDVERKLKKEQLDEICRLAANLVKLFLLTRGERDLSPGKGSLIEGNLGNNRANVQVFGIDPEYLEVIIAECCKAEAVGEIASLLKAQCDDCSEAVDCGDAQNPPPLCTCFSTCWNKQNYDEFGRSKENLVMAKLLTNKFL